MVSRDLVSVATRRSFSALSALLVRGFRTHGIATEF